jgi:hypothetical protein
VPGAQPEPFRDTARNITFPDDTEVIGVSTGGGHRAYLLGTLVATQYHIVNDVLERVPVSVTYCDRTDCARVFTGAGSLSLDLRVSGYSTDHGLVLTTGTGQYFQKTSAPVAPGAAVPFPFRELPSVRTTWREWTGAHPDTSVVYYPSLSYGGWRNVYPGRVVSVAPDEPVAGLAIDWVHRAYLLRAFNRASNFVIHDGLADVWVSVVHDVREHRTTALVATQPDASAALLTFAGWSARSGGVLLAWDGRRYECATGALHDGADHAPFPFRQVPVVSTTWSAWTEAHPDTSVYVGEFRDLVHIPRVDQGGSERLTALGRLLPFAPGFVGLFVLLARRWRARGTGGDRASARNS